MSGLFATFNTLRRAMSAQQGAINTTSHNISNANTEGYSRQIVTFETSVPEGMPSLNSSSGPGLIGTGVEISEITRARDEFLDNQIRNENSTSGKFTAREEYLSEVETIFMEPSDNGLSTTLGKMWDAWQTLSGNPESSTARTNVREASQTLADQITHTYQQLKGLQVHSGDLIKENAVDFNYTVSQIEDLNRQIIAVTNAGDHPNDLLDRQDVLIDKLSGMLKIKVDRDKLGYATISTVDSETNETIYITGKNKQNLLYIDSISDDGSSMTYYDMDGIQKTVTTAQTGVNYSSLKSAKLMWGTGDGSTIVVKKAAVESGCIEGYASVYNEIDTYKDQLNAMAKAIAYAVNTVHNDGHLPGDADYDYVPFFTTQDGTGEDNISAENIRVNAVFTTDLSKIKTNGIKERTVNADGTVTSVEYPATNGDRALAIARLRDSRININEFLSGSTPVKTRADNSITVNYNNVKNTGAATMRLTDESNGTTIEGYFNDIIARLGSSSSQASGMVTSQQALLNQLQTRKESISGVSMDEEIANLIQYQRAYQAAARALSMMDELLNTVVNGLIK